MTSDSGAWVVDRDGSRRLLGAYHDASWSPFGRFVVVAGENELSALEPDGDSRWSLARPGVRACAGRAPRPTPGSRTSTAPGFASSRVTAPATACSSQTPAGRSPGGRVGFVLAHAAAGGRVVIRDVATGHIVGRSDRGVAPRALTWSDDGRRLLAVAPGSVRLLDDRGRSVRAERMPSRRGCSRREPRCRSGPQGGPESDVVTWPSAGSLFRGTGRFTGLEWSPDGAWLLVGGRTPTSGSSCPRPVAVAAEAAANLSEQFRSRAFPRAHGWCCRP